MDENRRRRTDYILLRLKILHHIQKLIIDRRMIAKLLFHLIQIQQRIFDFQLASLGAAITTQEIRDVTMGLQLHTDLGILPD